MIDVKSPHANFGLHAADQSIIRIESSGAYIANDHLLREHNPLSRTPTPPSSEQPSLDSETDTDSSGEPVAAAAEFGRVAVGLEPSGVVTDGRNGENSPKRSRPATPDAHEVTKNITLPKHNTEVIHIAVDIGGTLTKLVYFTKSPATELGRNGGKLHFKDFQTEGFSTEVLRFMIRLIKKSTNTKSRPPITYILATGGGAHKFYDLMTDTFRKRKLPMKIVAEDEMECLIRGLDWLITKIPNEIFVYDLKENTTLFIPNRQDENIYPYLLVNIGSGVSMIKVTGPGKDGFERIGGSSLGGGTLWGLLSLLTDAQDYNEMLEMAQRGNNENIDLLVGDIYGASYNKIGLKSNHIASSFAKVFKKLSFLSKKMTPAEKLGQFRLEDIARLLLYLVSNNIGQIAYLQALRFGLKRIYFGGSYISGHMQTIHTLSYAVNFWSKGDMKSYFLRHEGYLGSVGAFTMGPDSDAMVH